MGSGMNKVLVAVVTAFCVGVPGWWATEVWSQQKNHEQRLDAIERAVDGINRNLEAQTATDAKVVEILDRMVKEPTPERRRDGR